MLHQSTHRVQFLSKLLNERRNGLTVAQIEEALEAKGFKKISIEGLRKALNKMHEDPEVDIKRVGSGYRDRYVGTARKVTSKFSSLAPNEMVRLSMLAQTDISQVLPRIIREELKPHQDQARAQMRYLKKAKGKEEDLLRWVDRVRLRRPTVRLAVDREEPEIDVDVETTVHEALTDRLPLKISYFSGHLSQRLADLVVYPIGLDCQLRWVTLVCQLAEPFKARWGKRSAKYGDDYVQMPLHRVSKASIDHASDLPDHFDSQFSMDEYISRAEPDRPRGGHQSFTQGRSIELVARVSESYANDLIESPLITQGKAQYLARQEDGWYLLKAEIMQTDNLLWWCAAMAGDLVVMEPESFRTEVVNLLDRGRELYR